MIQAVRALTKIVLFVINDVKLVIIVSLQYVGVFFQTFLHTPSLKQPGTYCI